MADIFVSYASENRDRIEPLVALLEREGWSVWWDRDLAAGPSFEAKIQEALDAAGCVVVAWSENSIRSHWCRDEAQEGLERNLLVPVRIDDVRPPLGFRSLQTASLLGWPRHRGEIEGLLNGVRQHLGVPSRTTVVPHDPEKAIAIMPFSNVSNDPEQEYFSDGIAEDILNELARGAELAVRPRSSSFSLKGASLDIETIGKRLNVTHVLDGSVRRSGNRVRVNVQLSEVNTHRAIWSERYDRDLTDIFEVQDEITSEVLGALNVHLGTAGKTRQFAGTEAYNAFLRGRHHLSQHESGLALEWFEKATQLDPLNADAWAGRARILDMRGLRQGQSLQAHREEISAYLDDVLQIDPTHPHALALKAEATFFRDREYQSAVNQLVAIVNANPNHEEAHRSLSWILASIGRADLLLRVTQRMVEISPLSREAMSNQIASLTQAGRIDRAKQAIEEFSRLQYGDEPNLLAWLAILDRDAVALKKVVDKNLEGWYFPYDRTWYSAMVPYLDGDFTRARASIEAQKRTGENQSTILQKHMFALVERDFDAALDHYADGLESGLFFAFHRANLNYTFRQIFPEFFESIRFEELLRKYKIDSASVAEIQVPELAF